MPIIFTEESKLSAITNAKKANLIKNSNQVVAGIELDSLNQQELKELLCRVRVFCRVTSEIKSKNNIIVYKGWSSGSDYRRTIWRFTST